MKKVNKFLAIILAILMVISIIPITASAETFEGTWGENVTWNFDESTGVLTISGYGEISGTKTWSSYNEDIKEIIIEEGITTIPNSAFYSCRSLVSVKLPDSVSLINPYAFFFCTSLESISIGIGVKTIGERAFDLCFKLKNVYYSGTKTQWKAISIGQNNSYITSGPAFYYNCVGDSGHAHIYETIVTTPATCTENGLGSVACTICGYSYPTKLTALGHTNVVIPAVLPTTTTPGHTRIETCSICDEVILEGTVIPILNETSYTTKSGDYLISVLDQSTDTLTVYGTGTIEYGHTLNLFYYEPLNQNVHFNVDTLIITEGITGIGDDAFAYYSFKSVIIADSVKSIGAEAFCGCELLKSVVVGDGVTYIGDSAFEDCCCLTEIKLSKGVKTIQRRAFYNCDVLNNVYYAGGEHDWNLIDIGDFNGWLLRNKIHFAEAPGHTYTSEITTPATHTSTGVMTYTCDCGDTYTEVIEIIEKHNYESVVTTPTCTEQGYTTYICECGDSYVDDYVDALGHTEETIPAVSPTCTEAGLTAGAKCSVCGETLTEHKELPANGHTPANAVEENYVAPTCTENGSKDIVIYCSVCDEEISCETVVINATGHNYTTVVTEPTCTTQGYTTYTCSCGETYVDDYVNATGHADNDGDRYCDDDNELLDPSVECDHNCHKNGISGFIWRIINFFNKIFGLNKTCDCGVVHY